MEIGKEISVETKRVAWHAQFASWGAPTISSACAVGAYAQTAAEWVRGVSAHLARSACAVGAYAQTAAEWVRGASLHLHLICDHDS